ncbi:MAG: SIS domain-containing protein [Bacillota bacterium]
MSDAAGDAVDAYVNAVVVQIRTQAQACADEMRELAGWMSEAVRAERRIFAFGSGHSSLLASELFYRTGGLPLINPIVAPGLTVEARPAPAGSMAERVEGYAPVWLEAVGPCPGEVMIVISVSGRNPAPVDMALAAREYGLRVAAVTSLPYSRSVASRHSSGLRLFEVAELTVDIGGQPGDATVPIPGGAGKVGPTSTVVGAALLNAVVCRVVCDLADDGDSPPVFMSANEEGGDEHNRALLDRYRDLLTYL